MKKKDVCKCVQKREKVCICVREIMCRTAGGRNAD